MKNFITNLRTYLKFLSRNKVYSFVSIFGFSIALMFVILLGLYAKQELSVDSFHEKKDRIYLMTHDYDATFGNSVAPFVQDKCPEVESFCRIYTRTVFVGKRETGKLQSEAMFVDSTFFTMFSFKLIEGNPAKVLEARKTAVVTQEYAHKVFGAENPIGKSLIINDDEHTITGIMESIPNNSQFPQVDFVANYRSITNFWGGNDWIIDESYNFGFTMYFLEKEGASLTAKIPTLLELFKENFWYYKNGFTDKLEFLPLEDAYFTANPNDYSTIKTNNLSLIKIYGAIAILILVIATLNYVNMTMAQAGFRGKEAAIKKLLGSSKKAIVGQLLLESLLMTLLTFLLGLLLAYLAEPYFNEVLATKIEIAKQFTAYNIGVSVLFLLLISFLSGLVPAMIISGFNPIEVVKGTFSRKVKSTYSKALIIFQYLVALTLLICTFFIKQQADYLVNYDLGYQHNNIFTMGVGLDSVQTVGFKDKLLSMSGVERVAFTCGTPMDRGNNNSFEKNGEQFSTQELLVDDDFFEMYGVSYSPADVPFTEKSLLINNNLFNSSLTNKENMTIDLGGKERSIITGTLSDFHLGSLNEDRKYLRIRKRTSKMWPWSVSIQLSPSADQFALADQIQKEYTAYTGGEVGTYPQFADAMIQNWYKKESNLSKILSAFTILTIIISVMGVLAMSLYMIKQKEKEIGIRKVNGATEGQMLWMLNKESLIRLLIAFVIASPIAYYAVSTWLEDFSYKIAINWWTFLVAGGIVALLTLISVSYMTWKAARANPVTTLKSE